MNSVISVTSEPGFAFHIGRSIPGTQACCYRRLAALQVERVLSFIDTHIDTSIHVDDLAALVHMSPFYFCRVFRATFGLAPHHFVMLQRVERAKRLLLSSSGSLSQIAAECGMADQAHFNRLFRRFVGATPGAWRRLTLASAEAACGQA
jgi:AraC family transcriptional regulator